MIFPKAALCKRIAVFVLLFIVARSSLAQDPRGRQPDVQAHADEQYSRNKHSADHPARCALLRLDKCLTDVAKDQVGIWTSPLRLERNDLFWLLPFAGAVGSSVYYDRQAMDKFGRDRLQIEFGRNVSGAGSPYVMLGTAGSFYVSAALLHNQHLRETGVLGGEAVVDSLLLAEGLKLATNRDRPTQGNGNGDFWPHGTKSYNLDSSMPSSHSMAAWSLAKVISSEFPQKPWLRLVVYGTAATISASRVMARDHFPSDVVVGSTFGYLTGAYVMRRHENENRFSFNVSPVLSADFRSYGIALHVIPPHNFNECALLDRAGFRTLRNLDRECN